MIYNQTLSAKILQRSSGLKAKIENSDGYNNLKNNLRSLEIDQQIFYITEGDLLLDEDELLIYSMEQDINDNIKAMGTFSTFGRENELLGIINAGKTVRWKPGLILTYRVLKTTFRNEKEYKIVKANMKRATTNWEAACGIKFKHISRLDNSNSTRPEGVIFPVRGINANGQFIASAFFPTYPKNRWRNLIDPSYFTSRFNKIGILRHELGHVIGLRHEHIRSGAPAVCPNEELGNTIKLTDYDPNSVMHYFCGGVGSKSLTISELDKIGSQKLYGPPFKEFDFIG
ncbi:MAG: hypothetical protein JKY22_02180 [Flavobacteriaceae bacterium]|nr:hypothetical protein [Flavobacteriaceae bacterium]